MTTYPDRAGSFHWTLLSLLRQSVVPDTILVILSTTQFPGRSSDLPRTLRALIRANGRRVRIIWDEGDRRSFKKILPALERYPERVIVTADDDVLYPRDWLRWLIDGSERWPKCVVGTRGARVRIQGRQLAPYATWPSAELERPGKNVLLTGRGGILYPPGSLHPAVLDYATASKLCPDADDLWLKTMSLRTGRECVVVGRAEEFPNTARQHSALYRTNLQRSGNDIALVALDHAFDLVGLLT
ncbi:hypothetical protein QWY28_16250 [Nocardioides sp. SOB77]|uniref:Glycosyltransferase n=1 Tax=Nocardioides oceani TaxID=3058369 RepID=A0ABT8FIK5_9ACTN|nr:hypothetical protein [Nocardioides oceani]